VLRTVAAALAATMIFAPAAFAQTPPAAPAAPAPAPAAPAAAVSDADLKAFAQALYAIDKLRSAPGGLTQPAMLDAVQKAGIDPAKFNEMSGRMRTDQAFNQQVQGAVHALQAAAAPPPAPPAG
jgi:hypothetical protein